MSGFGKADGGGRRSAAREPAPLTAVFTTVTDSHSAIVVDVSSTGARLRASFLPTEGDEVLLTIETVRTFGTVRWSNGRECGVAFDEPLAAGHVQLLRHRVTQGRGFTPELKAAFDDWTLGVAR